MSGDVQKQLTGALLVLRILVDRLGGTVLLTADDYLDARSWRLLSSEQGHGDEVLFTVYKGGAQ